MYACAAAMPVRLPCLCGCHACVAAMPVRRPCLCGCHLWWRVCTMTPVTMTWRVMLYGCVPCVACRGHAVPLACVVCPFCGRIWCCGLWCRLCHVACPVSYAGCCMLCAACRALRCGVGPCCSVMWDVPYTYLRLKFLGSLDEP